jgi:hypothetical protein
MKALEPLRDEDAIIHEYSDPYDAWLEANLEEIAKYPDCFLAVDPKQGIILSSSDEWEFARLLGEIYEREPKRRGRTMTFHASLFL